MDLFNAGFANLFVSFAPLRPTCKSTSHLKRVFTVPLRVQRASTPWPAKMGYQFESLPFYVALVAMHIN